MKILINECYELEGDYQNQFLGNEVFPKPKYKKLKPAERTVNKVHYNDVYILEPAHYYYVTLVGKVAFSIFKHFFKPEKAFLQNGLILSLDSEEQRIYIFNGSQNFVYLQKNTKIGEVILNG